VLPSVACPQRDFTTRESSFCRHLSLDVDREIQILHRSIDHTRARARGNLPPKEAEPLVLRAFRKQNVRILAELKR
jgi:hypothetical protein